MRGRFRQSWGVAIRQRSRTIRCPQSAGPQASKGLLRCLYHVPCEVNSLSRSQASQASQGGGGASTTAQHLPHHGSLHSFLATRRENYSGREDHWQEPQSSCCRVPRPPRTATTSLAGTVTSTTHAEPGIHRIQPQTVVQRTTARCTSADVMSREKFPQSLLFTRPWLMGLIP